MRVCVWVCTVWRELETVFECASVVCHPIWGRYKSHRAPVCVCPLWLLLQYIFISQCAGQHYFSISDFIFIFFIEYIFLYLYLEFVFFFKYLYKNICIFFKYKKIVFVICYQFVNKLLFLTLFHFNTFYVWTKITLALDGSLQATVHFTCMWHKGLGERQ